MALGAASDAPNAPAAGTGTAAGTAGVRGVAGKPEDVAQARLGSHWQLCGMLGEENERILCALCCELIDVLHAHAGGMPQPPLATQREVDLHACMHPRAVLYNVLQLLTQLGQRWDNARRLSDGGCVGKLLSMPVPALCTGSLEDITSVLQQIMEDPVHTHPVRIPSEMSHLRCAFRVAPLPSCSVVLFNRPPMRLHTLWFLYT